MNAIEHIEGLVSSKMCAIKTIVTIAKLEARLAGLSVLPLLLNVSLLVVVFLSIWLTTLLLIGYGAMILCGNILCAIVFVLFINLVLMFGLIKYLEFNLKNISFEKTRAYFSNNKDERHDANQKEINQPNCDNAKSPTVSTSESK